MNQPHNRVVAVSAAQSAANAAWEIVSMCNNETLQRLRASNRVACLCQSYKDGDRETLMRLADDLQRDDTVCDDDCCGDAELSAAQSLRRPSEDRQIVEA